MERPTLSQVVATAFLLLLIVSHWSLISSIIDRPYNNVCVNLAGSHVALAAETDAQITAAC